MKRSYDSSTLKKIITKTSPLYGYWQSMQKGIDQEKIILLLNQDVKTSNRTYLLQYEPYKWEVLFQCLLREIIRKEQSEDCLRGFNVLLSMLNNQEVEKIINRLSQKQLLSPNVIDQIRLSYESKPVDLSGKGNSRKRNPTRFIRILTAIYLNPYRIEIKNTRKHLYEHTGYVICSLMNLLTPFDNH